MKANIVFVLASFAILKVCAGRVFDEKTEAKKEIETKFQKIVTLGNKILKYAEEEKKLVSRSTGETELKNHIVKQINESKIQFENDSYAALRTAIVQAKPVAVIYCIRNVIYSGYKTLDNARSDNLQNVDQVKFKKLDKIEFDIFAVRAILSGIKELMEQAKKKIDTESSVIQEIKKEALKRCESATLLLEEIEVYLHEPVLNQEYIKLRQKIDKNLQIIKENLKAQLDKCLSVSRFHK